MYQFQMSVNTVHHGPQLWGNLPAPTVPCTAHIYIHRLSNHSNFDQHEANPQHWKSAVASTQQLVTPKENTHYT